MVFWRFKDRGGSFFFGYVTYVGSLVRLGTYSGDVMGGSLVDPSEIEWRPYNNG
jgi:hypothetical protein